MLFFLPLSFSSTSVDVVQVRSLAFLPPFSPAFLPFFSFSYFFQLLVFLYFPFLTFLPKFLLFFFFVFLLPFFSQFFFPFFYSPSFSPPLPLFPSLFLLIRLQSFSTVRKFYGLLIQCVQLMFKCVIRECSSTPYIGLARAVPPTNTNFWLTFLLIRLQEALYEDLAVWSIKFEVYHPFSGLNFVAEVNFWRP